MQHREVQSEAHLDAPRDLVRMAHRHNYTGNLGGLRGVEFVGGVAQNGVAKHVAERLVGIMGHDLYVVGPWSPAVAPGSALLATSAPAPAPMTPPAATSARKR